MSFNNFPAGGYAEITVNPGPETGERAITIYLYRDDQTKAVEVRRKQDILDAGNKVRFDLPMGGKTYTIRVKGRILRDGPDELTVVAQGFEEDDTFIRKESHTVPFKKKHQRCDYPFFFYT